MGIVYVIMSRGKGRKGGTGEMGSLQRKLGFEKWGGGYNEFFRQKEGGQEQRVVARGGRSSHQAFGAHIGKMKGNANS